MTILCRTNACAVANLLNGIASGKRPFLVGGGADVIKFVEAAQSLQQGRGTSHPELACFGSWGEVEEYSKLEEGSDLKLMVKLIGEFGCRAILDALRRMPQEKDADLIISTAHKSKGREWDHVRLASDFPTKSKCSDPERKLLYVAVTRAKLVLDVSNCPFFTGKDSLDISNLKGARDEREQGEREEGVEVGEMDGRRTGIHGGIPQSSGTQAATGSGVPARQEAQAATTKGQPILGGQVTFTWTRFRDAWMLRGPKGRKPGEQVTVERKSGSTSRERLGAMAWENGEVAIYRLLPK